MQTQSPDQQAPSVLIVDDTPQNLQLLVRMLKERGYKTRPASSGRLALDAAHEAPPDLILLDITMPEMNGYEVCERLKADPELNQIPVIFISALTESLDKVKAFGLGGVDYVTKPFQAEEVEARVKTHLALYRQQRIERALLENTLNGSIKLLTDIICASDAQSFGRARKLRDLMRAVVASFPTDSAWEYELAAMLAGIGLVTIPSVVISRFRQGLPLSSKESAMLARVPRMGYDLLCNIPRLEPAAQIVLYQDKNFDGTGFPNDSICKEDIPHGARVLRILADLLKLEDNHLARAAALSKMRRSVGQYDPKVLETVAAALSQAGVEKAAQNQTPPNQGSNSTAPGITKALDDLSEDKYVSLGELRVGHILKSDVNASNGTLIVAAETVVSDMLLMKLHNFAELTGIVEPIKVRCANPVETAS